jgi:hypothetical protein
MKSPTPGVVAAAGAAALQFFALSASAAVVQYCGPNLCYEYDNAQAAAVFYGQPGFAGDDAYFLPNIFEARSADGVGIHSGTNTDTADATWVFSRIWSINPNNEIASIYAYEEGDYEINYADGTASGDLYLAAFGLNAVEASVVGTDSVAFAGDSGGLQNWDMSTTINPSALLTQVANNLQLTIQNTLTAFTSDTTVGSELAYIEKKLILEINTVIPVGVEVPVPAAVWLFGSALGMLTVARRRRAA